MAPSQQALPEPQRGSGVWWSAALLAGLFAACSSGEPFGVGASAPGKAGASGVAVGGASGETPSDGGAPGGVTLPPSEGGAAGASPLECPAGFDDCNDSPEDGCETPLDTTEDCGACRRPCLADTAPFCAPTDGGHACKNPVEALNAARVALACEADTEVPELCSSVPQDEASTCQEAGQRVLRDAVVEGEPGAVYDVTLRVRGVVELKDYAGGEELGDHFYRGGEPAETAANTFTLEVSEPPERYFFNAAGSAGEALRVYPIDHTEVVTMASGAQVTLGMLDADCAMVRNCQSFEGDCEPYAVDGVVYQGQFVRLDVVKVTPRR